MNQHNTFAVLARPPFVLLKALCDTYTSRKFQFKKGQSKLFRLQTPMSYENDLANEFPEIASMMEYRIDAWLKANEYSLSQKS